MEQTSTPNREQAPTSGRETQKSEDAEVVGVPLSLSRAARYVSAVFSPLLIPTYAVAMAMWITPLNTTPENVRFVACVLVLFITGGIPMAMLLTLLRLGRITDVDISDRRQRTLPTLLISLCYVAAGLYIWRISAPWWMIMFLPRLLLWLWCALPYHGGGKSAAMLLPSAVSWAWLYGLCCRD